MDEHKGSNSKRYIDEVLPKVEGQSSSAREYPVGDDFDLRLAEPSNQRKRGRRKWPFVLAGLLAMLIAIFIGAYLWYQASLESVDVSDNSVQKVEIKEGSTFSYVAGRLEERGLIRSSLAFRLLAGMEGKQSSLKAGSCNLTPADTSRQILDKITEGCHDFMSITFYPGATLETSPYAKSLAEADGKNFKDMSIRASLRDAGFSDHEITEAFNANYNLPLFADKPSSQDYEGYIYGETYYVDTGSSVKDVLRVAFDEMYSIVESEDLVEKYRRNGLNLYEGIVLASIVERELDCEGRATEESRATCHNYQRRIAEVFYNRLKVGMSLGADVTSIYAADKMKVPASVDVDSPYNTRRYTGLPPGPIGSPGKAAMLAVANPTIGDDMYFLAGDDGLIYFAKNGSGHQENIKNHCRLQCGDL